MTKTFVTFTDPHLRMKTPQARNDVNWLEQCVGQIEAVFAIAHARKARAVLCSGDVGDSPAWSDRTILRLWEVLAQYGHIPFYTTVGQHDVRGHRIEDWRDSSLGLLATVTQDPLKTTTNDGLIRVLEGGRSVTLDGRVEVYGFGFNQLETKEFLDGKFAFPANNRFKIALVHAQVGPQESMGWLGIENQRLVGCHLASFGDIHCGFAPHEFPSGAVAYSTGSLVRTSLTDIGRVPMCAVVEVHDDNTFDLEFIDVPDGDDKVVFYTKETVQAAGDVALEFKGMVQAAREHQDESPRTRVARVGTAHGFTERQIGLVVDRLEEDR